MNATKITFGNDEVGKNANRGGRVRVREILSVALAAAVAAALSSCDYQQVAGSSVGTGNPTEIAVGFTSNSTSVAMTGHVDVYASTQIPVPGFAPKPLATVNFSNATSAVLDAKDFATVPDSLWPKTSREGDSIYRFNAVVTGEKEGLIMKGFGFRKKAGDFVLRDEDKGAVVSEGRAVVSGAVLGLVPFRCLMDSNYLSKLKINYLFMYGTGYFAVEKSGEFNFPLVPKEKPEVFMVSVPGPDHISSGNDSTNVYGLTPSTANGDSLSVGSVFERIPLPDSLKTP